MNDAESIKSSNLQSIVSQGELGRNASETRKALSSFRNTTSRDGRRSHVKTAGMLSPRLPMQVESWKNRRNPILGLRVNGNLSMSQNSRGF